MSSSLPHAAEPLGQPLPLDEHACSVSLPTWSNVVGYEEGDADVTSRLKCGYPRFVYHPYVLQLMQVALELEEKKGLETTNNTTTATTTKKHTIRNRDCLVLPSSGAALRCRDFLVKALGYQDTMKLSAPDNALLPTIITDEVLSNTNNKQQDNYPIIRILPLNAAGVHAVTFPAQTTAGMEAKAYWQHTGEVVSSRRAEAALVELGLSVEQRVTIIACDDNNTSEQQKQQQQQQQQHVCLYGSGTDCSDQRSSISPHQQIQDRIAHLTQVPSQNVFLTPSGMASIYAAVQSARRRLLLPTEEDNNHHNNHHHNNNNGGTAVVYGFPYLDTLKLCSRSELVPGGVEFFGRGHVGDLQHLKDMLEKRHQNRPVSLLITEFPSNPLLHCPDLVALRQLADEYNFCLLVDDTISNFLNVNLLETGLADALCTSLTKLFNGRCDAMAGSVICNPHTERGRWMQRDLLSAHEHFDNDDNDGGLWKGDAHAIWHNSKDFGERNRRINETSEKLADWLHDHEEVDRVYYPKYTCPEMFDKVRSADEGGGGYGGLLSILLEPHICQRTFYDHLDVAKGPSLGTNFTLVCPYTLLAHYHELDFAMTYNVQPNLLRIAVGLEDYDELQDKFAAALSKSRLHPKICMPRQQQQQQQQQQQRGYCTTTAMPSTTTTTTASNSAAYYRTPSRHRRQSDVENLSSSSSSWRSSNSSLAAIARMGVAGVASVATRKSHIMMRCSAAAMRHVPC